MAPLPRAADGGADARAGRGRGPTLITDPPRAETYLARVVALRRGDSTFFRPFVSVAPPQPLPPMDDSSNLTRKIISLCGQVGMASQTHDTAPRTEEPDDSLPLRRRRP